MRTRPFLFLILVVSLAVMPGVAAGAQEPEVIVEEVASGLEVPWALAFAPDGRLFVTERPGRIRVIEGGSLRSQPFATVEAAQTSESGLMGIALDPLFVENGYVYVVYTYRGTGNRLWNRVVRLTDVGGEGRDPVVILDGIPASTIHDGGALKFGPDGKLYLTTGDAGAGSGDFAPDLRSLAGKVLRLNADGTVPADNPFVGSYVFTYGHRNPQGMDWHPLTGALFITEHGPADNDEVNILEPGQNYGWPVVRGVANSPPYRDPIASFTPTIAVAGASFYSGGRLPAQWRNSYFFVTLKGAHLRRLTLAEPAYRTVTGQEELFSGRYGRLRAVEEDSQGYLYFTTSNRDGRATPGPRDDRILRLASRVPSVVPPSVEPPAVGSPGNGQVSPPAAPEAVQTPGIEVTAQVETPSASRPPAVQLMAKAGAAVLAVLLLLGSIWFVARKRRDGSRSR